MSLSEFFAALGRREPTAMMLGGAVLLVLTAVGLGIRALVVSRRTAVLDRLRRVTDAGTVSGAALLPPPEADEGGETFAKALRPLSRLARPTDEEQMGRIKQFLVAAGYRSDRAVDIYLGAKVVLCLIGLVIFLLLQPRLDLPAERAAALALVLVAIGFYFPTLYVTSQRQERQKQIVRALPDTLDLLVTSVEAGLGIDAALKRVGEEMQLAAPVLSEELRLTALEMSGGISRADAFRRLAARTQVEDLKTLAAVLVQSEMFGTSVAKSLRVQSDSLRLKRMQRAEEAAAKVAVKLTLPLIMFVLPSLMTVLMGTAVLRFINLYFTAVPDK